MFTLFERSDEFERLNSKSRELALSILEHFSPDHTLVEVAPGHEFLSEESAANKIYFIREGFVCLQKNERPIFFYEPGDLISEQALPYPAFTVLRNEAALVLDEYDFGKLSAECAKNSALQKQWNTYTGMQHAMLTELVLSLTEESIPQSPKTSYFEPGDPIIIQETEPKEVYTMVQGTAEVFVGETKVGEVHPGDIFGAMAASLNSRRLASVIASTKCVCSSLPKENFFDLLRTHPKTVYRLIEDMAGIVVSLNEKLVELES